MNQYWTLLPVITFISGTLSGDKSIILGFLSKASLRILFFVAEPHSLYNPEEHEHIYFTLYAEFNYLNEFEMVNLPTISKPRLSISSTHLRTIIGTEIAKGASPRSDCIEDETDSHSLLTTLSKSAPNKLAAPRNHEKCIKK